MPYFGRVNFLFMENTLINLTAHTINILDSEGNEIVAVPPSGTIARCENLSEHQSDIVVNGKKIPLNVKMFGKTENLPEYKRFTLYIVSFIVQQANPDRRDLIVVDEVVREGSLIKGNKAFCIQD
jgi:hypothetical protein